MVTTDVQKQVTGPGEKRIKILHIVHRLGIGGLENGVANLIDAMSEDRFQHSIACLTTATSFQKRIRRADVVIHELHKAPGNDIRMLLRLWRLLRRMKPDIVHTRNLGTLECQLVALLAGVKCRIHGEHGWDMHDPAGNSIKYQLVRRVFGWFVNCFVPVSRDLEQWLNSRVGIPRRKLHRIYNGVDTTKFSPARRKTSDATYVIGHVGRLEQIKNQMLLLKAFHCLLQILPPGARVKLVIVGDGALMSELVRFVRDRRMSDHVDFAGSRDDIAQCLRSFQLFVLPSLNEGISNTILEAMSCGLAVVATAVGGNRELVEHGNTGMLVSSEDETALTEALFSYVTDHTKSAQHGANARKRIKENFDLRGMTGDYAKLYEKMCIVKCGQTVEKGNETCAV